jgi:hypothetical protein
MCGRERACVRERRRRASEPSHNIDRKKAVCEYERERESVREGLVCEKQRCICG